MNFFSRLFARNKAASHDDRVGSSSGSPSKTALPKFWAVAVLLILWQLAAMLIGQDILLASPVEVFLRLLQLIVQWDFWRTVAFSMLRILGGFLLATLLGTLLAIFAAAFPKISELIDPVMTVIKATPVASFTILVLIWVSPKNLALIMSLLMVIPIIYQNVKIGIQQTNVNMLEMARVFDIALPRRIRFIYLPEVLPFFRSACAVSVGLCWKAGVAAEVIGIPAHSIGEKMYEAKIYLETADLFTWTLVVILFSLLFERLFLHLLNVVIKKLTDL